MPRPDPISAPDPTLHRRRLIRWLALLGALLMLGVIAVSAYIRLAQTGVGCSGWPQCQGDVLRQAQLLAPAADPAGIAQARRIHRLLAPAVLLLSVAILLLALLPRPRLRRAGRLGLFLLLLALLLAALGIAAGRSGLPAVVLGNLLGGFLMLAVAWRLAAVASAAADAPASANLRLRRWARWGLLLLALQVALGGLISATHGASACSGLSQCREVAAAAGWDWRFLNPWLATPPEQVLPGQPRGAWLQQWHHLGALLVLLVLAWIAWLALRQGRRLAALALYALLVVQLMLGLQLAPAGFPLPQVLAHNLAAALLVALLARWA